MGEDRPEPHVGPGAWPRAGRGLWEKPRLRRGRGLTSGGGACRGGAPASRCRGPAAGGGGSAGPMWRTLAVASAFFPGLFALCVRALRWAAPGWSVKDRVLLSGRYGRGARRGRGSAGTGPDPVPICCLQAGVDGAGHDGHGVGPDRGA